MSKPLRAVEFCAIRDWCKLHGIKVIEGHSLTIVPDRTPSPELVELRKDKERLDFYFGIHRIKGNNALIDMEIKSFQKDATPDEWRTAIDAAKEKK